MIFLSHGISGNYRLTLSLTVNTPINHLGMQHIGVFNKLNPLLIKIIFGVKGLCSQEASWICMSLERSDGESNSAVLSASTLAV